MKFVRLNSVQRDIWVEQRFGLDKQALEGFSSHQRVVAIVFQDRLPPKLVILRGGDVVKLQHTALAVYDRAFGWME